METGAVGVEVGVSKAGIVGAKAWAFLSLSDMHDVKNATFETIA